MTCLSRDAANQEDLNVYQPASVYDQAFEANITDSDKDCDVGFDAQFEFPSHPVHHDLYEHIAYAPRLVFPG